MRVLMRGDWGFMTSHIAMTISRSETVSDVAAKKLCQVLQASDR
jgi:hypothetical protein